MSAAVRHALRTRVWRTPAHWGLVALGVLLVAATWLAQPAPDVPAGRLAALLLLALLAGGAAPAAVWAVRERRLRALGWHARRPEATDRAAGADRLLGGARPLFGTGEHEVVSVAPIEAAHDRNLRWFAGALQHAGEDAVARAVARLSGRGVLADVVEAPGQGRSGMVDRHPVRVGAPGWVGMATHDLPPAGTGQALGVEVDGRPMGCIVVAPVVHPDLTDGLAALRGLGVCEVLLCGDEAEVAFWTERGVVARIAAADDPAAGELQLGGADGDRVSLGADTEHDVHIDDLTLPGLADVLRLAREGDTAARRAVWASGLLLPLLPLATLGVLAPWLIAVGGLAVLGGATLLGVRALPRVRYPDSGPPSQSRSIR